MPLEKKARQVYFVGIGGIGMSGLARLMSAKGDKVAGSDQNDSALTSELQAEGIPVSIGHKAENLPKGCDLLVFSEAVAEDNPERQEARQRSISELNYFQALGEFAKPYRVIAVSGTHGKTTTTAMLGLILIEAGLDPTVLVGSKVKEFGGKNVRLGQSDLFVVEACEYRRNFLPLYPWLLGVLNMELDHLDYFKDEADYKKAFQALASQSQKVIWPRDYQAYQGPLGVPGEHNRWNAGMARQLAKTCGVSEEVIEKSLSQFQGTWRRMEYKGQLPSGALLYDDYAHHPTEIRATLQALREKYPKKRLIAVFQPHQYSRTHFFLEEFAHSFERADQVIFADIYAARDTAEDKASVSLQDLLEKTKQFHPNVLVGGDLKETEDHLKKESHSNEVLILMGAGNIGALGERLITTDERGGR